MAGKAPPLGKRRTSPHRFSRPDHSDGAFVAGIADWVKKINRELMKNHDMDWDPANIREDLKHGNQFSGKSIIVSKKAGSSRALSMIWERGFLLTDRSL